MTIFVDDLPRDHEPDSIKAMLAAQVSRWEYLGHPALLERYVLRNGHEGKAQPRPKKIRKRTDKECFKNAAELVIEHAYLGAGNPYTYVEGFAIKPRLGMLIHHAWCEDDKGNVIDPTWKDPETALYYGVSFSLSDLRDQLLQNRVYGLLDLFDKGLNTELMFDTDPGLKPIVDAVIDGHREKLKARRAEAIKTLMEADTNV